MNLTDGMISTMANPQGGAQCSAARLAEQIVSNLPQGIFCVDVTSQFIYLNPAACHMLDIQDPQEVIGKPCHEFLYHYPSTSPCPDETDDVCPLRQTLQTEQPQHTNKACFRLHNNRTVEAELDTAPLYNEYNSLNGAIVYIYNLKNRTAKEQSTPPADEQGRISQILGTAREVSSSIGTRHQLQQELQNKTFLLNAVSHDLRAPLSSMLSLIDLVNDTNLDHHQHKRLELCQSAGKRALALLDTLLVLAKSNGGDIELNREPIDLLEFFDEQSQLLEVSASEKGLGLELEIKDTLPKVAYIDHLRLSQVLFNLALNAIKFTSRGYVKIAISRPNSDQLQVAIADTGPGIAPEHHKTIFQVFHRGALNSQDCQNNHGKDPGSGLGLNISQEFIKHMGGSIWLASQLGQGTTFFFTLPLLIGPDNEAAQAIATSLENAQFPGQDLRILIAEDDATTAMLARELVEKAGAQGLNAYDGEQALEIWRNTEIDMVLMDAELPKLRGPEVVNAIRRQESAEQRPRTPIFMLSGHNPEQHSDYLRQSIGVDDVLTKPLRSAELNELLAKVNSGIGRYGQQ